MYRGFGNYVRETALPSRRQRPVAAHHAKRSGGTHTARDLWQTSGGRVAR